MALYRCGGGGSASTLITKNITQNGTYDAIDDNADGYSSVNVNVSGGGNYTENTQVQWDALTFAQKKAQGATVIRNSSSQVSGAWYDLSRSNSEYLPFSSSIICEANINNFDASSNSWGDGSMPLELSNLLTANADGIGVDVNGRSSDFVTCDLGDINTDFTAYLVFKYTSAYAYGRVLSASYQETTGQTAYICEDGLNNLKGGLWGSDPTFGNSHAPGAYVVIAMRNNNKNVSFFKNGVKGTDKTANNVGRYVAIATSYPNGISYATNITVAYAGVVGLAETDAIVNGNIAELMNKFNIV